MSLRPLIFTSSLLLVITVTQAESSDQEWVNIFSEYAVEVDSEYDMPQLGETIDDGRKLVLMGEASHGTSEFYRYRAELSKYLIEEKGFRFIAVEGDWPAAKRVNQYVKHRDTPPETALEALEYFDRWPLWMWRNEEVKELIEWMREFNADLPAGERAGFYGIDMYDKQRAMESVVTHIEQWDSAIAEEVENTYSCLADYHDPQNFIQSVHSTGEDCEEEMNYVLEILEENKDTWSQTDSVAYSDAYQSAHLARRAEQHYRANLERGAASWNYRATHFFETTQRLLEGYGDEARGIVWAHNTHIGDARATDMHQQQMHNIGQLAREEYGRDQVFAVGFGTYTGSVYAGLQWEGERRNMEIPEARDGSLESRLEQVGIDKFFLPMHQHANAFQALDSAIGHRAMGVVYNPQQDQRSYVNTILPSRYDAFIFIRETNTLQALDD